MPDLERELRALGAAVEFPPTPDLAASIRARLAAPAPVRLLSRRRPLAIAVAVLVLAAGGVLAVPPARTAVLEWLGLRGVSIGRVPETRTVPAGAEVALGEEVTLAEARVRAPFRLRVPAGDDPDAVFFSRGHASGGAVSLLYGEGSSRLLLTQFRARIEEAFLQKLVGPGTTVEATAVDGRPAFWIEGRPHEIFYVDEEGEPLVDTARLAGNTLLWQRGAVTYRLEGAATEADAVAVARSLR